MIGPAKQNPFADCPFHAVHPLSLTSFQSVFSPTVARCEGALAAKERVGDLGQASCVSVEQCTHGFFRL